MKISCVGNKRVFLISYFYLIEAKELQQFTSYAETNQIRNIKKDICVEYIAHRCNKLVFLKMIPEQWRQLRACQQVLQVSGGSNCSKSAQNTVQSISTEVQKRLQNLLWKSSGKKILHYCFPVTLYTSILRIIFKTILGWPPWPMNLATLMGVISFWPH